MDFSQTWIEFARGLQIERDGDTFIVRGETTSRLKWVGAGVAVIGILGILVFANPGVPRDLLKLSPYSGTAVQVALIVAIVPYGASWVVGGVSWMLPRVFTTTFDPRSRLVVYSTRLGNRSPRTNRYSFEEIAGICLAVAEYKARYCYFPCLKLKGPFRPLRLVRTGLTLTPAEKLIEAISAATGLPILDGRPRLLWW